MVDEDAAFAHAVDEALGFHKELVTVTGKDANGVLSVLTRAETFVKWLAVEKKCKYLHMYSSRSLSCFKILLLHKIGLMALLLARHQNTA